jgi:hypothetical protein
MTKVKADISRESGCWTEGVCAAIAFNGNAGVSFVIPSEAEGSAVFRTSLGNVFERDMWARAILLLSLI